MVESYVTGLTLVVAMAVGWTAVQAAWRRVVPGGSCEPDALAGRSSCAGCSSRCARERATGEDPR